MEPGPAQALLGGALIGLASILLLLADGKIAGVSGALGAAVGAPARAGAWRWAFLAGLLCGGVFLRLAGLVIFKPLPGRSIGALIAAGLLVGLGTQAASGCTSGHGVCGLGRRSARSLAATATFVAAGAAAVLLIGRVLGGSL